MALTKVTHAGIGSTGTVLLQNLDVTGVGTFGTLAVGGTVSIGGTLTYEDVTNIDSVGLITARSGVLVTGVTTTTKVHVGVGTTWSEDLVVTGNARVTGILTVGTGSIVLDASADEIKLGQTRLTRDTDGDIQVRDLSGNYKRLRGKRFKVEAANRLTDGIDVGVGATIVSPADSEITFRIGDVEKISIDSSGHLGVGTTTPGGNNFVSDSDTSVAGVFKRSGGGEWCKVNIKAGTNTGNSYLLFSDLAESECGAINYEHSDDSLKFEVWNGSAKVQAVNIVGSDQQVAIMNNNTYNESQSHLTVATDGSGTDNVFADTSALYNHNNPGFIHIQNRHNTGTGQEAGIIFTARSGHSGNWAAYAKRTSSSYQSDFVLRTRTGDGASSEILRILNNGDIGIGTAAPSGDLHILDTIPRITLEDSDSGKYVTRWWQSGNATVFDFDNEDTGGSPSFSIKGGGSEYIKVQHNGEVALKSSGTCTDALANLHVQNGTFRVSEADEPTTAYTQITAHPAGTDGNRHRIATWSNANLCSFAVDQNGTCMAHASFMAGRTRGDANNAQPEMYRHGSHAYTAWSATTDDATKARTQAMIRAWDSGDTGDRNWLYFVDSNNDTTALDYDQHQKWGVKASGLTQALTHIWAGRVESDEGSPNSIMGAAGTYLRAYPSSTNQHTSIKAQESDGSDEVFLADTGGGVIIRFNSDGNGYFDGGADVGSASDYAEYFEWADGNSSDADRRGITVVMDGEKIRPATGSDDTSKIIGVVSANPAVVGDSAWSEWQQAHLKDAYGSWVTEEKEYLVWNKKGFNTDRRTGVKTENPQPDITDPHMSPDYQVLVSEIDFWKSQGDEFCPQWAIDQNIRIKRKSRTYNPDYDKTKTYVPRSDRKEWSAIGLVGKLVVRRGQPIGANWILMKSNVGTDPNDNSIVLDKYLVR